MTIPANLPTQKPSSPPKSTPEEAPISQGRLKLLFSKIPHPKLVIPGVLGGILILILFFTVISFQSNQKQVLQDKVFSDMQTGNYVSAGNLAKKGLSVNPTNPYLLQSVITANSLQGNQTGTEKQALEDSKPYISQILQADGKNANTLITAGYAYETAGEYTTALTYYDKAIGLNPSSAEAYFHKGHTLAFLGRAVESKAAYEKAYVLSPNNPQILMVRGNMFLSDGKEQDSFESFKKAADNANGDKQIQAEALSAASVVRSTQNNHQYMTEALDLSKQAVEANPNFSPALATYGYNLLLVGKDDDAIRFMQKSISANPRISRNYYQLGMLNKVNKQYSQAIQYLQEAIAHADTDNTLFTPENRQYVKGLYQLTLAEVYAVSGIKGDTLSLLKDAVNNRPSLKDQIKRDYQLLGFFKELSGNAEFITIVGGNI